MAIYYCSNKLSLYCQVAQYSVMLLNSPIQKTSIRFHLLKHKIKCEGSFNYAQQHLPLYTKKYAKGYTLVKSIDQIAINWGTPLENTKELKCPISFNMTKAKLL